MGEPLPFEQGDLTQRGHAIEARLYAEDPANDFAPSLGMLTVWYMPHLPNVRIDSGVVQGSAITHHYDPMLAKIIAWGADREAARQRLVHALEQMAVLGVRTNLGFLIELLCHPAFQAGALHTGFLQEHRESLLRADTPPVEVLAALAILATSARRSATTATAQPSIPNVWERFGRWRLGE
jgi:3-methylcrotonyl-CoA carboxylase alpha subunit